MYFKRLFEQILKETPLVKFIKRLRNKKIVNRFINIPEVNTEFDGYDLMIEYNGEVYSWFIIDNISNRYIENSRDSFGSYGRCIEDLVKVLKSQEL